MREKNKKRCNIFVIVTQLFCYVMLTRCVCYGDIMMMFHDDIFIINSNMTKYRPLCSFHEPGHERSTEKLLNCIAEITSVQLNWFWYKAISKLSNVCNWRSTTCDCQCVCASESILYWDLRCDLMKIEICFIMKSDFCFNYFFVISRHFGQYEFCW